MNGSRYDTSEEKFSKISDNCSIVCIYLQNISEGIVKISKHPTYFNYNEYYLNTPIIGGFEGGKIIKATQKNKYYLIIDESTMADFLDIDDSEISDQLVKVIEFETDKELNNYLGRHYGKLSIR